MFSVIHRETLALVPPSGDRTSGLQFFIVVFIQDEVFFFSLIIFTSNYLHFTERQRDRFKLGCRETHAGLN